MHSFIDNIEKKVLLITSKLKNNVMFPLKLYLLLLLTLSGAHFSAAPTSDMKVSIRVFGVADYESEVRFSKFKKWWNRMQIRKIDKMDLKY